MIEKTGLNLNFDFLYLAEHNEQIREIVNKYADKARMGKRTLITFCVSMFCAGAEYQKRVIDAEMEYTISRNVIGNWFITSMDNAIKKADIVCFADDFKLLLEIGKASYNAGINYAYDIFHDVILEVYDTQVYLL